MKEEKKHKKPFHDQFFKESFSNPSYALELISLVINPQEFESLKKDSIKQEPSVYSKKGSELRGDLVFSIKTLQGLSPLKIVFLLEHKSTSPENLFQQLLTYQTSIYSKMEPRKTSGRQPRKPAGNLHSPLSPILPLVVYHGDKPWTLPMSFHEYLGIHEGTLFSGSFLNYSYRLVDLRTLKYSRGPVENLTIRPILYIMKSIRHLSDMVLRSFFEFCSVFDDETRKGLYDLCGGYISRCDEFYDFKRLSALEAEVFKKEDRVMPEMESIKLSEILYRKAMKKAKEEGTEQGLQQGMQQGMQKGMQKGMQQGLEKGMEKGLEQGREKGKQETASMMLRENLEISLISRVTGLSEEDIQKIQSENSQ